MGGNVFKGKTDSIPNEFLYNTLLKYMGELLRLFPQKESFFNDISILGSAGKKPISGDIDLAIDDKTMLPDFWDKSLTKWNLNPFGVKLIYEGLKERAKTSTHRQLMIKAFLISLAEYINANSDIIVCDVKKITTGNMFTCFPQYDTFGNETHRWVQIDWMVGNKEWLKFSYYSDVYDGNVKGLHRTQLILSMFANKGYTFNHTAGIKDKATQKIVADTPERAIAFLHKEYNYIFTEEILSNYFRLIGVIKQLEDYDKIIDIYLKILDSTRCDIPFNLKQEWLDRKERLGLTGKFLPDDSPLKGL